MKKHFKYAEVFPNEAFIQKSIESHFEKSGFLLITDAQVDLIAEKPNEKWFVEAKGTTAAAGTDFNTALGQLLKWMSSPEYIYAIAVPRHGKYQRQCNLLSPYVRTLLKLRILVVDESGAVTVITPEQSIDDFFN